MCDIDSDEICYGGNSIKSLSARFFFSHLSSYLQLQGVTSYLKSSKRYFLKRKTAIWSPIVCFTAILKSKQIYNLMFAL
jgi:hypothetical protein